jgi:hypothetical protein
MVGMYQLKKLPQEIKKDNIKLKLSEDFESIKDKKSYS